MYSGKQNRDEINKGLCLVSISAKHPIFNIVQSYDKALQRNAMLEAKIADLEKAVMDSEQGALQGKFFLAAGAHYTNISGLASSITVQSESESDKPKKPKKKKRSKAMTSGPLGSYAPH